MKQTRNLDAHPPGADEEMAPDQGPPDEGCASRQGGWFSIDNSFFYGGWAAQAGPSAALVYSAIVMHANRETRRAWPSYDRLQSLTGLSRPTVSKGIKELARLGLIRVETRNGGSGHLYTILDISAGRCQAAAHLVQDERRAQGLPTDPAGNTRQQDAAFSRNAAQQVQPVGQDGAAGVRGGKELLPGVVKNSNRVGKETLPGSREVSPEVAKNFNQAGKETFPGW